MQYFVSFHVSMSLVCWLDACPLVWLLLLFYLPYATWFILFIYSFSVSVCFCLFFLLVYFLVCLFSCLSASFGFLLVWVVFG